MYRASTRAHLPALILVVTLCLAFAAFPGPRVRIHPRPNSSLERMLQRNLEPLLGIAALPTAQLAALAWSGAQKSEQQR